MCDFTLIEDDWTDSRKTALLRLFQEKNKIFSTYKDNVIGNGFNSDHCAVIEVWIHV